MLMSKNPFIGPYQNLSICNKIVEVIKLTKCLGITIDVKVKKLYQMRGMPKSTLSTIYFQGILPSVLYVILIWGNCSNALISTIENIHIRAARFIHRIKKTVPDIYVLSQAKWKLFTIIRRALRVKCIRYIIT